MLPIVCNIVFNVIHILRPIWNTIVVKFLHNPFSLLCFITWIVVGSVYVSFMSSSLDGSLLCTKSFFPIMMKTVIVTVAFVLCVGILTHFPLVVSCVLCYAHLLYVFFGPPSLFLTGIASRKNTCFF